MIPGKIRAALYQRSEGFCERCGMEHATNAHHRKNRSQGGQNVLSNLLHLCGSGTTGCHGYVTEHPTESCDAGWSVRSYQEPCESPVMYRGSLVFLDDLGNMREADCPPGREQCTRFAFGGGRCQLADHHEGKHFKAWYDKPGGFHWTDESQIALADKYSSGRD